MAPHPLGDGQVDANDVEHLCPEDGYQPRHDCAVCHGRGRITNDQMDRYLNTLNGAPVDVDGKLVQPDRGTLWTP